MAVSAAAPSGLYAGAPIAYASGPLISNQLTYASQPLLTGYANTIYKPTLELAPARHIVSVQPEVRVPALAKIGEYVEHVPTSVSHQSSSVVHNSAAIVKEIIAPVQKTYIQKSYVAAPAVYAHAPLIQHYY